MKAGARYAVLTAKHHDGVALCDTRATDLSAARSTPAGRDLVGPFAEAMRRQARWRTSGPICSGSTAPGSATSSSGGWANCASRSSRSVPTQSSTDGWRITATTGPGARRADRTARGAVGALLHDRRHLVLPARRQPAQVGARAGARLRRDHRARRKPAAERRAEAGRHDRSRTRPTPRRSGAVDPLPEPPDALAPGTRLATLVRAWSGTSCELGYRRETTLESIGFNCLPAAGGRCPTGVFVQVRHRSQLLRRSRASSGSN